MRAVDLFSGCGGLSLGLEKSGIEVVHAFDAWKPAIDVYNANFNHPCEPFDLTDYEAASRKILKFKPDLIAGGPPCQDFSHAGKRLEGVRASLTRAFAKTVVAVKPRWFLMENVDRAQGSAAYKLARRIFIDAGYGVTELILDASRCGVPQKRKRFFCIGRIDTPDNFLMDELVGSLSPKAMTVRDYLGTEFGVNYYYRHPRNYNRRGVFSIDEPAPTIRGVNRPVPQGYKGHDGDPVSITKNIRALTTIERARIQTFPKRFKWIGTKTDLEQMIGNAVPVELGRFVGNAINRYEARLKKYRIKSA